MVSVGQIEKLTTHPSFEHSVVNFKPGAFWVGCEEEHTVCFRVIVPPNADGTGAAWRRQALTYSHYSQQLGWGLTRNRVKPSEAEVLLASPHVLQIDLRNKEILAMNV